MTSKINIFRIILEHLATLRRQGDETTSWYDIGTFYGVPVIAAGFYFVSKETIKPEVVSQIDNILVAAFSIFAALLLNMQVLIIDIKSRRLNGTDAPKEQSKEDKILANRISSAAKEQIQELFANVSYAILISLFAVTITLLSIFAGWQDSILLKSVQLFIVVHFALVGLMVLKRTHFVFSND